MVRANVVTLIKELPIAHGVLDTPMQNYRKVYCEVQSVSQTESYQARASGLNPEYRLVLSHSFEYKGETRCIFRNVFYEIIRTYINKSDGIELTIQRVAGNAAVEAEADV